MNNTLKILLISLGISLILGVIYYFTLHSSKSEEFNEAQKLLKEKEAEYNRQKEFAQNLPKYEEELRRIQAKFDEARSQLPNESEIPDFLRSISKKARDSGLTIDHFKILPERVEGFYASVPVELKVTGSYHDVAIFFDEIGRLQRIVNASDLKLGQPTFSEGLTTLKAECLLTTFRFVETASTSK